jgi:hypothetical protein
VHNSLGGVIPSAQRVAEESLNFARSATNRIVPNKARITQNLSALAVAFALAVDSALAVASGVERGFSRV